VDERFAADMRAGYPAEPAAVTLGSPLQADEVLTDVRVRLPLSTVNRHGLVAGATGTGKTKTLRVIAGQLSDAGVPVFVADVKGDPSGLAQPIDASDPKIAARAASLDWKVEPRAHGVSSSRSPGNSARPSGRRWSRSARSCSARSSTSTRSGASDRSSAHFTSHGGSRSAGRQGAIALRPMCRVAGAATIAEHPLT
jgi:hypothetical protein